MSWMRSTLEASGAASLLPLVAVIGVVGLVAIFALVVFGAGRVRGRSGDADARAAQLEAQLYAIRGLEKPENAPAWDGEDRLGMPRHISEAGMWGVQQAGAPQYMRTDFGSMTWQPLLMLTSCDTRTSAARLHNV